MLTLALTQVKTQAQTQVTLNSPELLMSLRKKDILINIRSKAHISLDHSSLVLESILSFIKNKENTIKIPGFGVFYYHESPSRIGRNPKTKEVFKIPSLNKLSFRASDKLKKLLN